MAQRVLNTNFWTDNWVEELDPIEKLVFIYLITNPLNNLAWAYEISIKRISYETGLEENKIIQILQKFQDAGKIVKYENWIVIVNFIKNQSKNPKIETGIKRIVSELPKAFIYAVYDTLCIAYAYPMYSLSHFTLLNFTILNYIDFNISSLRSEILKQPSAENFKWEVEKSLANLQTSNAEISAKNFLENKKNCKNPQSSSEDTPKGGETVGNDLDFSLKNFSENTEKTEKTEENAKNQAKKKFRGGDFKK